MAAAGCLGQQALPLTGGRAFSPLGLAQEAAATAEALEAERAAKFAADAEAKELQRVLDEVRLLCWRR